MARAFNLLLDGQDKSPNASTSDVEEATGEAIDAHAGETDPHSQYLREVGAYSGAWNPASVAVGASTSTTVAVTGATLGMHALASLSISLAGLVLTAHVSSAGNVTAVLHNPTGGAVDLGAATLRINVFD